MRFVTGAKYKSGSVVVRPEDVVTDARGRVVQRVRGLRAKFRNHTIDTDALAFNHKWTDEDHQRVVDHLLEIEQRGIGRAEGRGIYRDDLPERKMTPAQAEETGPTLCMTVWAVGEGSEQCTNPVVDGEHYCDDCLKQEEAAKEISEVV